MTRQDRVSLHKKQERLQVKDGVPLQGELQEGVPVLRKTVEGLVEYVLVRDELYKKVLDKANVVSPRVASTIVIFDAGDTTPPVLDGNLFKTDASSLTLTTFDGGTIGQIINIISTGTVTYSHDANNFKCGSADIVTAIGDVTQWVFDGTNWYLLSWMDVDENLANGSGEGF